MASRANTYDPHTDTLFQRYYWEALAEFYKQPRETETSIRAQFDGKFATLETVKSKLEYLQTSLREYTEKLYDVEQVFSKNFQKLIIYMAQHLDRQPHHQALFVDRQKELTAAQLNNILGAFARDNRFNALTKAVTNNTAEATDLCHIVSVITAYAKNFLYASLSAEDRQLNEDIIKDLRDWGTEASEFSSGLHENVEGFTSVVLWDKFLKGKKE
ncbi:hypothetical protein H4R34_006182 [Dimargaris verticillata]|uniref:Uncharacterized protein n=1 Tax=Dimargaris verticillata TaxID=2761393 RepID=A0A9W8AWH3_9FUNG|nr:hypothetical protein H4R34_006182 [Dimargaris verticillata]